MDSISLLIVTGVADYRRIGGAFLIAWIFIFQSHAGFTLRQGTLNLAFQVLHWQDIRPALEDKLKESLCYK